MSNLGGKGSQYDPVNVVCEGVHLDVRGQMPPTSYWLSADHCYKYANRYIDDRKNGIASSSAITQKITVPKIERS